MRRALQKRGVIAALLLLFFLAGLLFGLTVIGVYPLLHKQRPGLLADARAVAQSHLADDTGETLLYLRSSTTRILICGADGTCLRVIGSSRHETEESYQDIFDHYLPDILAGEELFRVIPARTTPPNITHMWLVAGAPTVADGHISGAVFLVKNLENLQEAVWGYFVSFTILYWLAAHIVMCSLRKKRHLDAIQQTYIANVTHALKTPNASIKALAETLCDGMQPDPNKQGIYFGMILREASKQEHMIRDILALSGIQSNRVDFTKSPVDPGIVFEQIRQRYCAICECAGIALVFDAPALSLPPLYTNEACLVQLFEILIDNALKFVDENGEIHIEAALSKSRVTFCVRDNGTGITQEDLPHVFERFYKDVSRRNESGSGLGLAIAHEIIANLKEKIWVESEPNCGAAFYFTVQLK